MSPQESAQAFHEIFRVAKPGARLVFWNNLVHRDVPPEISSKFEQQGDLENELKEKERVFFYNCFRIYKILK
jgi:S-adenosylmethionine-diacylglycerol 3-amino-3-carboxypropyl transferase